MKKIIKIVLGIIALVLIIAISGMFYITRGLEEGENISVERIENLELADGVYIGEYDFGRWSNKIELEVQNQRIVNIKIIDDITFDREDVSNQVISSVIENQNIDIDVVSGATVSSKSYLKAIENALTNRN